LEERRGRGEVVGWPLPSGPDGLAALTFGDGELAGAVLVFSLPEPRLTAAIPEAERAIAKLLYAGLSLDAIAKARGRSRFTIMNQVRSLYGRLGIGSRSELVRRITASAR
jgi:DNA-binding NarL/FixJ family response regulator